MGAGLAKAILNKYPNVKKEYQSFRNFNLNKGLTDKDLLGLVNYVRVSDVKVRKIGLIILCTQRQML